MSVYKIFLGLLPLIATGVQGAALSLPSGGLQVSLSQDCGPQP